MQSIQRQLEESKILPNLQILAYDIVEGYISGMHKSPFHGFSSEFSEYKPYTIGDEIKKIDWKRYAKTDKLYIKRYNEETNLRCHIVIDNSTSMNYPQVKKFDIHHLNKIQFSSLASACLINFLKKQRDAVGMSIYSERLDHYYQDKGSEKHFRFLYQQLSELANQQYDTHPKITEIHQSLQTIAEKIHKRSLVFIFTDMLQTDAEQSKLLESLRCFRYNNHKVVLFHTYSNTYEMALDFDKNVPIRFVDVETNEEINTYVDNVQQGYKNNISNYFKQIELNCLKYKIDYMPVAIEDGFDKILNTYLVKRQKPF